MTCHSDLNLHSSSMVCSQSVLHVFSQVKHIGENQWLCIHRVCVYVVSILMSLRQIPYLLTITHPHEIHATFLLCVTLRKIQTFILSAQCTLSLSLFLSLSFSLSLSLSRSLSEIKFLYTRILSGVN